MIHIPRPPNSTPTVLSDSDGKVSAEIARARAHIEAARKKKRSRKRKAKVDNGADEETGGFGFALYRKQEVKDALEALYHKKCAYCENKYKAAHPVDVEHWRPKGSVNLPEPPPGSVREPHPGYYWLAAKWENLLPSCINCNRASKQVQRPTGERVVSGKGSLFPLLSEDTRAYITEDLPKEAPLLLDPSRDHPEDHLEFVEDFILRASTDPATKLPCARGTASISVFGLNRQELVEERREVMLLIDKEFFEFQELLDLYQLQTQEAGRQKIERMLESKIAGLMGMTADSKRFALLARSSVLPFLNSIAPQIPAAATRDLVERATRVGVGTPNGTRS